MSKTIIAILREEEKPVIARIHKSILDVALDELKAAFDLRLQTYRVSRTFQHDFVGENFPDAARCIERHVVELADPQRFGRVG